MKKEVASRKFEASALLVLGFILLHPSFSLSARAQGTTAFTYQGRLNDGANPAAGIYDLRFSIYDAAGGGNQVGPMLTNAATGVSNGLFTVALDFGANILTNTDQFLEIGVRTNGAANFTTLSPRQKLTPAPYAIFAENVGIGGLTAGTYGSAVTFNNAANSFSGTFSGNGASVTNVNAATLSGLAPSAFWQLSGNSISSGHFLGTTDNQALELKANSLRAFRIEPGAFGSPNIIGGSAGNFAGSGAIGVTIAGGGSTSYYTQPTPNTALSDFDTISGGISNSIGRTYSTGFGQIDTRVATIGGGYFNTIQDGSDGSVVAGGLLNTVATNSGDSVISGGYQNFIGADNVFISAPTIGGGGYNTNSGAYATIPGGLQNRAAADYSFAAGRRAKANHPGAFVWADSTDADFASTGNNQLLIRASGGVGIGTTAPEAPLHVADGSAGTVTANANSIAVLEKSGNGYLSFLAPAASESGIIFGSPSASTDGAIIFNNASAAHGIEFRTGTNATQMTILANGNVGVGTTSPSREFEVQNAGDTEIGIKSTDGVGHLWTIQSSGFNNNSRDGSFQIIDRTIGAARVYVLTNGNVGIGRIPSANELELEGNASKTTAGSWLANSDARIKTDVQTVTGALDALNRVRLVSFRYSDDYRAQHPGIADRRYLNVVAQEFQKVFPDAVRNGGDKLPDGEPILQVDTYPLTIYSASAIQELNQKVDDLKTELNRRDAENAELKKRLDALEKIVRNEKSE